MLELRWSEKRFEAELQHMIWDPTLGDTVEEIHFAYIFLTFHDVEHSLDTRLTALQFHDLFI